MPPKTEHQGALTGSRPILSIFSPFLLRVLSLISPAMAPAHRPVRRPNMSDCPAQKLPVTHQHPPRLGPSRAPTRASCIDRPHRCATVTSFCQSSHFQIPISGPPSLNGQWVGSCGGCAGHPPLPVITTFYLSASCRPASAARNRASPTSGQVVPITTRLYNTARQHGHLCQCTVALCTVSHAHIAIPHLIMCNI